MVCVSAANLTFGQTKYSTALTGTGNMNNNQIDYAYTAKAGWNGYLLSGVDNVHKIPGLSAPLTVSPPAARIFKLTDGNLYPVWEAQQSEATLVADSNKGVQQYALEYSKALNCFVNVLDNQNNGQDHHHVQLFDTAFRMIADIPAGVANGADLQFTVEGVDTFIYSLKKSYNGYIVEKRSMVEFERFNVFMALQPDIDDTIQSQLHAGNCIAENADLNDRYDLFRPNSIELISYGDSNMICVSERNTGLVRIWMGSDNSYRQWARIGGAGNAFATETWIGAAPEISGGQDFRLVRAFGTDSFCVSYLSGGGCAATTAKGYLLMWYPAQHQIRVLQTTDLGINSNDLGSYRVVKGNSSSMNALLNAPKLTCFGKGNGRPETDSISGLPVGYFPINDGGQIDMRVPGDATPLVAIDYTNIYNWDSKLRVATPSRAVPFTESPIRQPYIDCTFNGDSIELSVNGMYSVHSWNNCDATTATITVPRNVDATYMMKGKWDANMFGMVYSEPVTVADGACTGRSLLAVTSLSPSHTNMLRAYPNPTRGELTIEYDGKDVPIITNSLGMDMGCEMLPIANGYKTHIEKHGVFFVTTKTTVAQKVIVL